MGFPWNLDNRYLKKHLGLQEPLNLNLILVPFQLFRSQGQFLMLIAILLCLNLYSFLRLFFLMTVFLIIGELLIVEVLLIVTLLVFVWFWDFIWLLWINLNIWTISSVLLTLNKLEKSHFSSLVPQSRRIYFINAITSKMSFTLKAYNIIKVILFLSSSFSKLY